MVPERRMAERAQPAEAIEAELATSLADFREELEAFSIDRATEQKYRDAIDCLRKVAVQVEGALQGRSGRLPGAPSSVAEHRFQECLIHSSEDLLHQSRRILSEMRALLGRP